MTRVNTHILVGSVLALLVASGAGAVFAVDRLHDSAYGLVSSVQAMWDGDVLADPAPLPDGINQNFLRQVEGCFLPVASAYGYDLRITSGWRSPEEQDELFEQGRNARGDIVTYKRGGRSLHNFGYAVDVVDRDRGYSINWDRLKGIAEYCGLRQGPEGDQAHYEYRGGLSVGQFVAGKRPLPLELPCPIMAERAQSNAPLTREDLRACGAPEL